jgi:hypothetical protein
MSPAADTESGSTPADAELPGIVIIGAQKAATTMLAAALGEHPQVEFAPGEFHGFVGSAYGEGTTAALRKCFRESTTLRRGFKCASYLGHPEAAARLATDLNFPDVVVALRDPVHRAVSAWYWSVRAGYVPLQSHNVGLRRLLDSRDAVTHDVWQNGPDILGWGRYAQLLEDWWAVFPRRRVHIVLDQELRSQPEATIKSLYRTLGLDADFEPTAHSRRYNEGNYSLLRLRWLRLRHRWVWQQDENAAWFPRRPKKLLPAGANAAIVGIDRLVLSHLAHPGIPTLDQELERDLRDYYRNDVLHLQELLDIELDGWLADAI